MRKLFDGIFLVPFFILGLASQAQVNSVSPYSKLGLGERQAPNFARGLAMGGANLALRDAFFINNTNPASYSNLELTTFEAGFHLNFIKQEQRGNREISIDNSTAGLNYFSFGVPLTDWWGSAIGIQPYSAKGYNISNRIDGPDNIAVTDSFIGHGGINQVYWGNAFEVAEGLSLGVNASFLFGSLTEQNFIMWEGPINDVLIEEDVSAKGFRLDYGLQYGYEFSNRSELSVGLTFANKAGLSTDVERHAVLIGGNGAPYDSLVNTGSGSGEIVLPSEFGVGITYGQKTSTSVNHAWQVSGDFELYTGQEFRDFDGTGELVDAWKAQIGGHLVPSLTFENLERSGNYFGQIEYRFGGFYEKTPYLIRTVSAPGGEQITDYGITFGLGFPVRQRGLGPGEVKRSFVNTGVILGRRGTLDNSLIRESYINIYVGITLNDKWFIQYKYR